MRYTQDVNRAKAFYESVFQVTLQQQLNNPEVELWAFPREMGKWGTGGALVKKEGKASGGNSTIKISVVRTAQLEQARVIAAGGMIQREKWSIGEYGFIALAEDSEGNMFGLPSLQ